jgi:hypothetical protein
MQQMQRNQIIKRMVYDSLPFPKEYLNLLKLSNVPGSAVTWSDLKSHIVQNKASLPDQTYERCCVLQQEIYDRNPPPNMDALARSVIEQNRLRNSAPQQPSKAQQPPPSNADQPLQTVPPAAPMQAPLTVPATLPPHIMQLLQATPQEVQAFRMQMPRPCSEELIRQHIMQSKYKRLLESRQKPKVSAAGSNEPASNNVPRNGAEDGSQVQHQPLPTAPSVSQPGRLPNEVTKPNEMPGEEINGRPPVQNVSVPSISAAQSRAHAQLQSLMRITPQQIASMTPEQQNKLAKQKEILYKQSLTNNAITSGASGAAQAGIPSSVVAPAPYTVPPLTPAEREKISLLFREVQAANPKGPAIVVDQSYLNRAQEMLSKCADPLDRMDSTYPEILRTPNLPIEILRNQLRAKWIVSCNLDNNKSLKDLSVTIEQIQEIMQHVGVYMNFFKDIRNKNQEMHAARATQIAQAQQATLHPPSLQQQPTQPPSAQPGTLQPAAVTAASHATDVASGFAQTSQPSPVMLAMKKSASQQANHTRKTSSTAKPPPAPTENRTFDWGTGAGLPKYDSRNELTPDKLKFPPSKKRKAGADSAASTPTAAVGTPTATAASPAQVTPGAAVVPIAVMNAKTTSPEQAKGAKAASSVVGPAAMLPWVAKSREKKFRCSDPACVGTHLGFDTEDELTQHVKIQHEPIGLPLDFLLGNAENLLTKSSVTTAVGHNDSARSEKLTLGEAMERSRSQSHSKQVSATTTVPSNDLKAAVASVKGETAKDTIVDGALSRPVTMRDAMKAKLNLDPRTAPSTMPVASPSQVLPASGASHFPDFDLLSTNTDGMGLFDWDMLNADAPVMLDAANNTAAVRADSTATPLSRTTSSAASTIDSDGVLFTPPSTSGNNSDVEITPHDQLTLHARLQGFVATQTWSPYPGAVAGIPVAMEDLLFNGAISRDVAADQSAPAGGLSIGGKEWLSDDNYFDLDAANESDREGISRGQKKAKSDDEEAQKGADIDTKLDNANGNGDPPKSSLKPLTLTANDFETILFDWDGTNGIAAAGGMDVDGGDDDTRSGMEWEAWIKG